MSIRWLVPALLVVTGAGVFAAGVVYGVVTVGVPTPDASPAVAARETADVHAAGLWMSIGLVLGMAGVAGFAGVGHARAGGLGRRRLEARPHTTE